MNTLLNTFNDDGNLEKTYISILDDKGDIRKLSDIERDVLVYALKRYKFNHSQIGHVLGIHPHTVRNRLKGYRFEDVL